MLKFKKRQTTNSAATGREVSAGEFIPYNYHYDKNTIITKNGELMQVIKLSGFAFETADDEDVDMRKMVRNSMLKSLAEGTFAMWFHTIRRKQGAFPEGKMPDGFAGYVNERWKDVHENQDSYVNELYITIVRKEDSKGVAFLENALKKLSFAADKESKDQYYKQAHKDLNEATYRLLATFKDYGARLLTVHETEFGPVSEPMQFLSYLVNCEYNPILQVPNYDISRYIAQNRLYFGTNAIEIRGAEKSRYASIVSIKEYSPHTAAGMLDAFLQLPFEFVISQSCAFINRQTNIGSMQTTQRRMMAAQDVAVSQVAEIADALDMAMSGHIAFSTHHLTVMTVEDNLEKLEKATSMTIAELVNIGMNPIREKLVMEQCYWAQLPANFDFIGRKSDVNTLNISALASLHNYPTGKIKGNHWGDAVSVLDTTSGTPYFFNFHLRDVGHTTIIGPTGAGKTVSMNFLCAQAQKYNCRMFVFDKDRGADIFVRAIGGKYNIIEPGERCGFNPLKLPDTVENRAFLGEWMRELLTTNGENFTAEDQEIVSRAIDGNYRLDPKDRKLSNLAAFLGADSAGSLASRFRMWHGSGQYAGIFDNEEDTLDFSDGKSFGFEMGQVLDNKVTLKPVLLYLFHRVNMSLDGTPTMIILDEAWALIDNDVFAKKIKDWLKTLRKLNGMVIFATQSVEDATNSAISDTLIQQTATQIFLPNPKATDAYKTKFMLSEREFSIIKSTDPGSRFFLLKHGKDVVVARIDLSGMDDIINILSARAETLELLDPILKEHGEDPDVWIPIFQKAVLQMSEKDDE